MTALDSSFYIQVTNEFASFCIDNYNRFILYRQFRQMAIFMSLPKWGKDLLDSLSIKTNKILYDFCHFTK